MIIDLKGEKLFKLNLIVLVDGIFVKKNLGIIKDMVLFIIVLGFGFCVGEDVDVVIEIMRGYNLGRIIINGRVEKNIGVLGVIKGFFKERVMYL